MQRLAQHRGRQSVSADEKGDDGRGRGRAGLQGSRSVIARGAGLGQSGLRAGEDLRAGQQAPDLSRWQDVRRPGPEAVERTVLSDAEGVPAFSPGSSELASDTQ